MEVTDPLFWIAFHSVIAVFLAIDLRHYQHGEVSFKDSVKWTVIWIVIGLAFSVFVLEFYGVEEFIKYITAYATEKLLSVDNLFVFLAIFTYFAVPYNARPLVLFAGIVFAIVLRFVFIVVGITLLETYHWMVYVFGAALIYSGYKMARGGAESIDPSKNRVVIFAKRFLPLTHEYHGQRFTVKTSSQRVFTPLILVLLAVETTDIMFAFDSVPAVLAITREFFTAYTSNVMAILGLRALYFVIEHGVRRLKNLGKGLSIYLIYLGVVFMLSAFHIHVPEWVSLLFIITILLYAFLTSERGEMHKVE